MKRRKTGMYENVCACLFCIKILHKKRRRVIYSATPKILHLYISFSLLYLIFNKFALTILRINMTLLPKLLILVTNFFFFLFPPSTKSSKDFSEKPLFPGFPYFLLTKSCAVICAVKCFFCPKKRGFMRVLRKMSQSK